MKAVFNKKVKYGGIYYAAGAEIEINPSDRRSLEEAGADIIEEDEMDFLYMLSVDQLKAYADEKGIDLGRASTEAGVIKKIKEAELE